MVNETKQYSIGIDIGGTKIRGALWNGEKVIADYELATPLDNLEHFLVMVKAVVDPLFERTKSDKMKVGGIGVGIPGVIDKKTGKLYGVPNLVMLEGKSIKEMLAKMFNVPVFIDNDANVFVRGEALAGAGKQFSNIYGLTIGTGIGGAWWINKDIYNGFFGGAGEPGHMLIDISANLDLEGSYQKLTQNNPGRLSQEAILGDVLALKAYEEFGRYLGVALANIINILDPEAIVLGGSVVNSADLFLSSTKKTMKQYVVYKPSANKVKLLKSKLGKNAGVIGAALLVT